MKVKDINLTDLNSKFINNILEISENQDEALDSNIPYNLDENILLQFNNRNINENNINQIFRFCDYLNIENTYSFIIKNCEPPINRYQINEDLKINLNFDNFFFLTNPKDFEIYNKGSLNDIYKFISASCNIKLAQYFDTQRENYIKKYPNKQTHFNKYHISPSTCKYIDIESTKYFLNSNFWSFTSECKWSALAYNNFDIFLLLHNNNIPWNENNCHNDWNSIQILTDIIKKFKIEGVKKILKYNPPEINSYYSLPIIVEFNDINILKWFLNDYDLFSKIKNKEQSVIESLFQATKINNIIIFNYLINFFKSNMYDFLKDINVSSMYSQSIENNNIELFYKIYNTFNKLPDNLFLLACDFQNLNIIKILIDEFKYPKDKYIFSKAILFKNYNMLNYGIQNKFPLYENYLHILPFINNINYSKVHSEIYYNKQYQCYESHNLKLFNLIDDPEYEFDSPELNTCYICNSYKDSLDWYGCPSCHLFICIKCYKIISNSNINYFLQKEYLTT